MIVSAGRRRFAATGRNLLVINAFTSLAATESNGNEIAVIGLSSSQSEPDSKGRRVRRWPVVGVKEEKVTETRTPKAEDDQLIVVTFT